MNRGFTLIELIVVIAIIAVLSGVILFSVNQYINRGKDANVYGNLAILITAGEAYYNGNNSSYNNGTNDFCNPQTNSFLKNIISQIPQTSGNCHSNTAPAEWTAISNIAGLCCKAISQAWVACAPKSDGVHAFCVDSRGWKEDNMPIEQCTNLMSFTQCP